MARTPVTVTVTGAAGQIGYALLFRIASGQLLGPDLPVHLRLLEITPALKAAEGTAMELDDCAFPLLQRIDITDDAKTAFDGVNVALLVGARPRTAGMERGDLLEANGGIFKPQGEAINAGAADDVRVLVVGNPANTNALIAASHAPDVPKSRFTAMTRLDHNRAMSQLSNKTQTPVSEIHRLTIWGNHSATQYPDIFHAEVDGKNAAEVVNDQQWLEKDLLPRMKAKHPAATIGTVLRSSTPAFSSEGNDEAKTLARAWSGSNTVGSVVYGTEAGIFRKTLGVPTVVCGPGDIAQAHQPNEYLLASQIDACEAFMRRMVEWACRD